MWLQIFFKVHSLLSIWFLEFPPMIIPGSCKIKDDYPQKLGSSSMIWCRFSKGNLKFTRRKTRRPATTSIVYTLQFCWRCFSKGWNRFFKHTFHTFSNFYKFKNFLIFLQKKFTIEVEKTFLRNIIIRCAFYSKFSTFTDFEKIQAFLEKTIQFFNEAQILYVFEKSYYFSCILRQVCYVLVMTNFQIQNLGILPE